MILNDFELFRSTRSVEPFFIRAFRLILTILFFIVVISYLIYSLLKIRYYNHYSDLFISASNPPTLIFPDFSICPTDLNKYLNINNENEYYNMSNPYDPSEFPIPYDSELKISNITCNAPVDKLMISCNDNINRTSNGCWAFSPFNFSERMNFYKNNLQCNDSLCNISMLNNSYKAIILNISLDVSSSTDYLAVRFNFVFPDMNIKIPPRMRFNMYPFNKGQLVIFKFSTIIRRKHSSLLAKLFGFEPNLEEAFIDIETKELQQTLNSSYSTLVLQPKDNITYYEDYISHHSIGSIVSSAGGLYGALIGIYILLFGSTKLSPWGIVQKYTCCWNLREDYMHRLMKRYVSKAGIPLVENPSNLPPNATVENRIATLETLLREFFLDDSSLVTLKEIHTRCVRYQDELNAIIEDDSLQDDIIVSVNKNAPL